MRFTVSSLKITPVGLEYLGTYKNRDEIIADGREGKSFIGGPRFKDTNGDSVWNDEDVDIIGNPEPKFYGGFDNTFTSLKCCSRRSSSALNTLLLSSTTSILPSIICLFLYFKTK